MIKEDEQKKHRKSRGDQKGMKHNKAASKTHRERKDHKFLPESPPLEIDESATGSCPYRPTNVLKGEKEDNVTESTTLASSALQSGEKKSHKSRGDEKETQYKKASKTHKKRNDRKLLPETPPQEIDVSGNVTASSVESGKVRTSATGSPYKDNVMEPTTPSSSSPQSKEKRSRKAKGDERETKHKTSSKTHKKQRDHTLPSPVSSPPKEIYVPDNVTIASSIGGGPSRCLRRQPKSKIGKSREKSTCSDSRDGLLPPPWENYHRSRNKSPPLKIDIVVPANVPLESIFQSPRKIDKKSDGSKLSTLKESRH